MGSFYSNGKIVYPLSYALSGGKGAFAVIDTKTGNSTMRIIGTVGVDVGVTGTALLPGGNVVAMLSYSNGQVAGPSMAAVDGQTGALQWTSAGVTRQDIDQPVSPLHVTATRAVVVVQ